jgi:nitrate/nitrite transporter NarK
MFAAFILVVFHRFSPAGLLPVFTSELEMSTAEFALLSSSYFYLYSLLQIPVGFLLDYYGPRRVGSIFSLHHDPGERHLCPWLSAPISDVGKNHS